MDNLTEYRALVALLDAGSLTAAARALKLPKSTITRAVARLEERLETPLLERSGRAPVPTRAAHALATRARRALELLARADEEARQEHRGLGGRIRFSMPAPNGSPMIGELLVDALQRLPDVSFEVDATDRYVDLAEEQFDLVMRAGREGAGDWLSTTVAEGTWRFCVAEHAPGPETVQELLRSPLLLPRLGGVPMWPFADPPYPQDSVRLLTNDVGSLTHVCRAGLGVALLPTARGRPFFDGLRAILPELSSSAVPFVAMWAPSRQGDPRVEQLVALLRRRWA
jgi:DNA-binding transcriptional LysR family regulator